MHCVIALHDIWEMQINNLHMQKTHILIFLIGVQVSWHRVYAFQLKTKGQKMFAFHLNVCNDEWQYEKVAHLIYHRFKLVWRTYTFQIDVQFVVKRLRSYDGSVNQHEIGRDSGKKHTHKSRRPDIKLSHVNHSKRQLTFTLFFSSNRVILIVLHVSQSSVDPQLIVMVKIQSDCALKWRFNQIAIADDHFAQIMCCFISPSRCFLQFFFYS